MYGCRSRTCALRHASNSYIDRCFATSGLSHRNCLPQRLRQPHISFNRLKTSNLAFRAYVHRWLWPSRLDIIILKAEIDIEAIVSSDHKLSLRRRIHGKYDQTEDILVEDIFVGSHKFGNEFLATEVEFTIIRAFQFTSTRLCTMLYILNKLFVGPKPIFQWV